MSDPGTWTVAPGPFVQITWPTRIQRRRTAGWRMPDGAIYVGRPTKWGNPFDFRASEYCWLAISYGCRAAAAGRREALVKAYREWVSAPPGLVTAEYERGFSFGTSERTIAHGPRIKAGRAPSLDEIRTLRGKRLACFCRLGAPATPTHCWRSPMKMDNDALRRRPPRGPVVFSIHWDVTLGHIVAGALCGLGALLLVGVF